MRLGLSLSLGSLVAGEITPTPITATVTPALTGTPNADQTLNDVTAASVTDPANYATTGTGPVSLVLEGSGDGGSTWDVLATDQLSVHETYSVRVVATDSTTPTANTRTFSLGTTQPVPVVDAPATLTGTLAVGETWTLGGGTFIGANAPPVIYSLIRDIGGSETIIATSSSPLSPSYVAQNADIGVPVAYRVTPTSGPVTTSASLTVPATVITQDTAPSLAQLSTGDAVIDAYTGGSAGVYSTNNGTTTSIATQMQVDAANVADAYVTEEGDVPGVVETVTASDGTETAFSAVTGPAVVTPPGIGDIADVNTPEDDTDATYRLWEGTDAEGETITGIFTGTPGTVTITSGHANVSVTSTHLVVARDAGAFSATITLEATNAAGTQVVNLPVDVNVLLILSSSGSGFTLEFYGDNPATLRISNAYPYWEGDYSLDPTNANLAGGPILVSDSNSPLSTAPRVVDGTLDPGLFWYVSDSTTGNDLVSLELGVEWFDGEGTSLDTDTLTAPSGWARADVTPTATLADTSTVTGSAVSAYNWDVAFGDGSATFGASPGFPTSGISTVTYGNAQATFS